MKSSGPRSYLRQLAEPNPRVATPLIPRRPAGERGATGQSSLAAIPPIFDTVTNGSTLTESLRYQVTPTNLHALRAEISAPQPHATAFETTSIAAPSSQRAHIPSGPANAKSHPSTTPLRNNTSRRATAPNEASAERHNLSSKGQVTAAQPAPFTTLLSASSTPRTEHDEQRGKRSPGTHVHIGTIEVRIPPPPARTTQPATAVPNSSARASHRAAHSSRTAEPLARGLGWSHGLVQG